MTNRKSHTPFRLVPKSTTLDDLERPIRILLNKRCVFRSPPQKMNEDGPILSGQKCRPLSLVSGNIKFLRIFAGVLWRGGVKRQWGNRKRRFSWLLDATSSAPFEMRPILLYSIIQSLVAPLSPFQWPQNMWPWMTLTGCLALNSVFAPVWLADRTQVQKIIAWKLIKIDTYCQQCKSPAWTPVSGDMRFVRIFGGRVL